MLRLAAAVAALGAVYRAVASGAVAADLGVGRTIRPLGPLTVRIDAPREVVFDVIASPYLRRTPRALESKLEVLERGQDMVLAAHFTPVRGFVATTVETVRFEPPASVHFRLVRGPVPHVVERFDLSDDDGGTTLAYSGELGADLWALGRLWGSLVARRWDAAVAAAFEEVKAETERRARR